MGREPLPFLNNLLPSRPPPRRPPPFDNRVDGPIRAINRVGSQDILGPGGQQSFRPGGRPAPQREPPSQRDRSVLFLPGNAQLARTPACEETRVPKCCAALLAPACCGLLPAWSAQTQQRYQGAVLHSTVLLFG